jgi:hypothetical protein
MVPDYDLSRKQILCVTHFALFTNREKPHYLLTKTTKATFNLRPTVFRIQILQDANPDPDCWLSSHPDRDPYSIF